MTVAQHGVRSVAWNLAAGLLQLAVHLVRVTLLVRWLPVHVFGVYAMAEAVVGLSATSPMFGLGAALLHRTPETEDEDQLAAVHFTLTLLFTLAWALLLGALALWFTTGTARAALLALTTVTAGLQLADTPRLLLIRRVLHRRLALTQMTSAILGSVIALTLAWQGATLAALVALDVMRLGVTVVALYLWRPVWRPRLAWSPPVIRHFVRAGLRNAVASGLATGAEWLDKLWAGHVLGSVPLGFYSRACVFAVSPRPVLIVPFTTVARGLYPALMGDRRHVSEAFTRETALLLRATCLLAGIVVVVAPELVGLVLGPRWLPMLDVLRLMMLLAVLDPLRFMAAVLITAAGAPERVAWVQGLQLGLLVIGLLVLTPLGILGVGVARVGALVVATATMLQQARRHADFPAARLLGAPALALLVGLGVGGLVGTLPMVAVVEWTRAVAKVVGFGATFLSVLVILEPGRVRDLGSVLWNLMQNQPVTPPSG